MWDENLIEEAEAELAEIEQARVERAKQRSPANPQPTPPAQTQSRRTVDFTQPQESTALAETSSSTPTTTSSSSRVKVYAGAAVGGALAGGLIALGAIAATRALAKEDQPVRFDLATSVGVGVGLVAGATIAMILARLLQDEPAPSAASAA